MHRLSSPHCSLDEPLSVLTEGSAQTIWRNIYVIICNNPDWRALKTFGTNCVHSTGIASASAVPPDRHCFTVICLSPFLIQTKQQFKTFGADSGPILNQVAFQYFCKHNFYEEFGVLSPEKE